MSERCVNSFLVGMGILALATSGCSFANINQSSSHSSNGPPQAVKDAGKYFGNSFLKSPFVSKFLKKHKHIYVEILELRNNSPKVIPRIIYLKDGLEETIENSNGGVLVAASNETRNLASEERFYQMRHSRTSQIHAPGQQLGADVAIIGSVQCATDVENSERVIIERLKAIDLSDNEIVWLDRKEFPIKFQMNWTQRAQLIRAMNLYGDPCLIRHSF